MKAAIFPAKNLLSDDERKLVEERAKAAGLTPDEWLERALKAAIYAPVIGALLPTKVA